MKSLYLTLTNQDTTRHMIATADTKSRGHSTDTADMATKLTDTVVKNLPAPEKGNKIHYDSDVKGFGIRVTANGARAFILNYRTRLGRERRYTIGAFPDWGTGAARDEAKELKRGIDRGDDPLAEIEKDRDAKTVADLCDRYISDHLPKKREASKAGDLANIERYIKPKLGKMKAAEVTFADIDDLHRAITNKGYGYQANRVHSLLSKMFGLAVRWQWRADNPCQGIERNPEQKRERYLSGEELANLTTALAAMKDQQAANIIRLLLLTGARRGEVLAARWDQFDLTAGVWTKPGSTTKQKTTHRIPLSAPARQLLSDLRAEADNDAEYIFPGRFDGHRQEIKYAWRDVCIAAGIVTSTKGKGGRVTVKPSARIHDLRHTYASMLASAGLSLPIIGALLGHSQPATTARYSHLMDDPLRQATDRVGALLSPSTAAEIVPLNRGASNG